MKAAHETMGGFFEGNGMESPVYILAEWNEPHSAALKWALEKNKIPVAIAPDFSGLASRFTAQVDNAGVSFRMTTALHEENRARSVWFRRPAEPQPSHCLDADKQFVQRQWTYFQKNLFHLNDSIIPALWANRPGAAIAAESKLLQLQIAHALDMNIPELVVTNHAADVRRIIKKYGKVIFKTFHPHSWQSASNGNIYDIGVALLDADSELPEESIAVCPGIFQRYIEKAFDIRVTVIGQHMFAVRILKQSGDAYLDWRQHVLGKEAVMAAVQLPSEWEAKIRALMNRLGIVIGCVDLVVDGDGNMFFLEINQAGQFLFVEEKLPDVPLLRAMTAMLASGRHDYSLTDSLDVRFPDYKSSDAYERVMESYADSPLIVSLEE
ncbi:hypothetical protein ASG87_14935 [Frateuria sp. Soil773]|uniref:hypothetical protein n=1 Tax=Frateuria sp. Soil773 TaxID=1736407 RepID=UPI0006F6DED1|nr:hypothetical protein [Frateuria sp. Soil773]KRE97818.1 hypothetical protein ASG87_14935 [Frateuria sp. Soil773]